VIRPGRIRSAALLAALTTVAALAFAPAAGAATRHYWVAAVPETWNIVRNGMDPMTGLVFPPENTTMETVLYKRYTRGWGAPWPNRFWTVGDNDGIPGPTIRARVGDTVLVHFKNMDTRRNAPHSMHFHGFRYAFNSDGSFIPGVTGPKANVPPGGTATYRLQARRSSQGVWPYHDHSSSMEQSIAGGMYGAIIIRGRRERAPDRQNIVFFSEHMGFETVNGRAFIRNTPTFRARVGQVVEWNVLAIGSEHHTFHIHGHRWRAPDGRFVDNQTLGPADTLQIRFREDVRGEWIYHCHVEEHQVAGMIGIYRVLPRRR
jgi:FtsP/CotA-like multicopper oxidase with cupredoxin domain